MHYRLNRTFFPWIIAHSFEYWYYYLGAILSLYGLHHFSSEIPLLAKNLGDLAIEGKLAEIDIGHFFLLAAYILFFRTLSRLLFFYPARIQQRDLRMELVHRLEITPARNYKDVNDGMLFQTIYNDLNRIRGFMGFALLQFGNIVIAAFIFIPKIREFNPDFLTAFTPLLVTVLCFMVIIYLFQPWVKKGMDQYADVQNFLLESYEAKKTIQNYHSERDFLKVFNQFSEKEMRTFFISSLGRVISFPIVKLGVGASLIWAAYIVKVDNLPASDLIFFSSFLFIILEPLLFLSWIGIVTSQGYASWVRIKELTGKLDRPINDKWIKISNRKELKVPFWNDFIVFQPPEKEWTVLIGETGSGKSWVIENYAQYLSYHKIPFSMIHQEPYLYNDSLISNIFLGQDQTPEKVKKVKELLIEFGLDVLQPTIDDLLNMEIGENGKRVSGGQAKRICLIRSLISDVDYILWDDPFSSVDLLLEIKILNKLKESTDKTFIISSHRLSTVKASDYLIFIDKTEGIIEEGSVKSLLNSNSKADKFFEKQHI